MKQETKIRNALISLYWEAHTDGRLCENGGGILEHINSIEWADRRAKVINQALQKLGLSSTACSRRVQRRGAKVVKSKSKVRAGRTRG